MDGPGGGRGAAQRGPAALFAALFAATVLAGALVVDSRSAQLAIEVLRMSRDFSPAAGEQARIRFYVREDDADARVQIATGERRVVRNVGRDVELEAGERVGFRWDGRNDEGEIVRPGHYRLRVVLPNRDRDMLAPGRIRVPPGEGAP